jgi:hypothetical protein
VDGVFDYMGGFISHFFAKACGGAAPRGRVFA